MYAGAFMSGAHLPQTGLLFLFLIFNFTNSSVFITHVEQMERHFHTQTFGLTLSIPLLLASDLSCCKDV